MTFNQQFYDASVRHQIDLLRYGSGVSQKVNRILDETRADLRKQVERRLGKNTGLDGPGLRRLRELEKAISQQRSGAWNDVSEMWERTSLDLALEESLWIEGTLTNILPVELDLVAPSDATLRALAKTRPFQGKNLKEWADSVSRADLGRIHQQIRIGMVQGEGSRDIANRVFGARGAMSITANQVDAVTRTVVAGVANAAQQEFLKDNSDLFEAEQLVATLDARTTPICRAQDGKQYPVGEGPIPPLHVRCRSIRVAVIDGEVVGERPFKAGTEQQMLDEYTAQRGLAPVSSRDALPKGTKKGFDEFSRRRMRELTGQVPAHTTYQQWLGGQSAKFQDDVLGPARGKLFREGGLTLDKFVNRAGDELTLDELRERNREAFSAAGLEKATQKPKPTALDRERERAEKAERAAAETARSLAEEQARTRKAEADAAAAERDRKNAEARAKAAEQRQRRIEAERKKAAEREAREREEILKEAREKQERIRAAAQAESDALSASSGPKTRAEALAVLRKFVDNPVILDTVNDQEVINAATNLRRFGAEKIYGPSNKLENLVLGARKNNLTLGSGEHGPIEELSDEAGGLYSNRPKWGQGYIKVHSKAHDASQAQWEEQRKRQQENARAIDMFYRNSGREPPPDNRNADGLLPLGIGNSISSKTVQIPRGQEMTSILVHEFGHAVHLEPVGSWEQVDAVVRQTFDDPKRVAVSGYGETDHREYFAESHLAYRYRGEELRQHAPKAHRMVEEVLRLRGIGLNGDI